MNRITGLTWSMTLMILGSILAPCAGGQDAALPNITPPVCEKPPSIDGDLSDSCWEKAARAEKFTVFGKGGISSNVVVKVVRDNEWLYVAFEIVLPRSETIQTVAIDHDAPNNNDDSAEIFLDPGTADKMYYHYMLNPANVRA